MRVESSPQKRVEAHLYPAAQGAGGKGAGAFARLNPRRSPSPKHAPPFHTIPAQEL